MLGSLCYLIKISLLICYITLQNYKGSLGVYYVHLLSLIFWHSYVAYLFMFLLCNSQITFYGLQFYMMTLHCLWTSLAKLLLWHHQKDKCFLHSGWMILSKQWPANVLEWRKKHDDKIWAGAAMLIHVSVTVGIIVVTCSYIFLSL